MEKENLIKKIKKLKRKREAIIIAHVYQRDEIQKIADFTGDSLFLSRVAMNTKAKVILFCGVRFMAETAAVLNPDKIVLIPEKNAGCPLADTITPSKLKEKKREYPEARVVSYVNSSAEIKAESDLCCTSANAIEVVNSLKEEQILFVPDKNLGRFVASHTDKDVILWDGFCYVHHLCIKAEDIKEMKIKHPRAKVIVHPECPEEIINMADFIGSTSQMADYVSKSNSQEFIVGTEIGMLFNLKFHNPEKRFYPASEKAICEDMKLTTLEKIASSLEKMEYQVKVPKKIEIKAKKSLNKMLEIKHENKR
ncbi:quinolinate synthase NadA [Candidatus Aerophobetes bacterium]|nr:quinolinate synthase NadA [Candidatus Aerophobetes bacterium]